MYGSLTFSPPRRAHRLPLPLGRKMQHHACEVSSKGISLRWSLFGTGPTDTLYLACTKIPDSQEESRGSAQTTLYILGTVSPLYNLGQTSDQHRGLLTSPVSKCQPSTILQAGLSQDGSLGMPC